MGVQRLLLEADRHHASGFLVARIYLGHTLHVYPGNYQRPGPLTLPRHPFADLLRSGSTSSEDVVLARPVLVGRAQSGTGISTRYPSTTPCGLALGPD